MVNVSDKIVNFQKSEVAWNAEVVDLSSTDHTFSKPNRIYVGVTGNVIATLFESGTDITFVGVPAGAILNIAAKSVKKVGTTATNLVGLS